MRFGHIELFCLDTTATQSFYESLGFTVTTLQPGGFVWLALGDVEILLRPGTPHVSSYAVTSQTIVLYVPSVLDFLAEHGLQAVGEDSPGCPLIQDPDGRYLQVVEPPE